MLLLIYLQNSEIFQAFKCIFLNTLQFVVAQNARKNRQYIEEYKYSCITLERNENITHKNVIIGVLPYNFKIYFFSKI